MDYKSYKRQLVISQVLDKPLEGKYLEFHNYVDSFFKSIDLFKDEDEYPGYKFYFKEAYMFHTQNSILYISQRIINRFLSLFGLGSQDETIEFISKTINHYLGTSSTLDTIYVLSDFKYRQYDVHFSKKYIYDNRIRNKIIWH
jgi:hypothetical protein